MGFCRPPPPRRLPASRKNAPRLDGGLFTTEGVLDFKRSYEISRVAFESGRGGGRGECVGGRDVSPLVVRVVSNVDPSTVGRPEESPVVEWGSRLASGSGGRGGLPGRKQPQLVEHRRDVIHVRTMAALSVFFLAPIKALRGPRVFFFSGLRFFRKDKVGEQAQWKPQLWALRAL